MLRAASVLSNGFASETSTRLKDLATLLATPAGLEALKYWLKRAEDHPDSELSQFIREEGINPSAPPANVGERLGSWALTRLEDAHKAEIRSLSAAEKWLLDEFIKKWVPDQRINFDAEVKYLEQWHLSRAKAATAAEDEFSAFGRFSRKAPDAFEAIPDQHEAAYRRKATAAFIKAHPPLARLQSEGWNLDGIDAATLGKVFDALTQPLPGKDPELTYFIDPKASDHDAATDRITEAWRGRTDKQPSYLLHEDIDRFLQEHSERTVILVGHIADQFFEMERGPDRPPLMLNIPDLMRKAVQFKVLIIPVGCNSAEGGAPYGFTRPIASDEVAKFIKAIPAANLLVADILAAFGAIGPIAVDPTRITDQLSIVIRRHSYLSPVTVVRVPAHFYARPAPSPQAQMSYQQFTDDWIAANRPWHDRGGLASLRTFMRHIPGAGIASVGLALGLVTVFIRHLRRRIEGTSAQTGTRLCRIEGRLTVLATALVVIGLLYAIVVALWSKWLLLGVMIVLYLAVIAIVPSQ